MKKLIFITLLLFASPVFSAVYHIDPTVGTSGTGTAASPLKAWTDLPAMSTGDDVYFKCGTTLTPTSYLSISWEGTSGDPVVIGAYWLDGATAKYELNGDRPVISGNDWTVPNQTSYKGLINVENKDYVQIKDLHIYRSGFYGIYILGNSGATETSYGFLIDGCKLNAAWRQSIIIHKNPSNYGTISNNEVTKSNSWWELSDAPDWGATIAVISCASSYTTIKNNLVYTNYGEGTNIVDTSNYGGCGYATIEDNIYYDNRAICGVYIDRTSHNTVRSNLILGNGSPSGTYRGGTGRYSAGGRYWNGPGIVVDNEVSGDNSAMSDDVHDNYIYNNLVAGTYRGLVFSTGQTSGPLTALNVKFLNNTVIGAYYDVRFGSKLSAYTLTGCEFKNNIFWRPSDGVYGASVDGDASWVDSKINPDYNAWTGSSPTYAGGANDVVLSSSDSNFEKTSGWQSLTGVIDAENFKIKSTSSLIDEATDLSSIFTTDYFEDTRTGTWDIGADEYVTPGGITPSGAVAYHLSSAPTIDGALTEWTAIEGFDLVDPTTGKTGTYKIGWDSTYLYIAGDVTDTTLNSVITTRDGDVYLDDSFEMVLGSSLAVDDDKEITDYKLTLNIGGYSADWVGTGTTSWSTSWTPTISQAFVNTGTLNDTNADTGYTFEARISWTDLGVSTPNNGAVWQFDLRQNDTADDDTQTDVDFNNSDGLNFNNPLGWGRLEFTTAEASGTTQGLISLYEFEDGALTTDSFGTSTLTNNNTVTSSTEHRSGSGSADFEESSSQYMSITDANLPTGFPGKSGETNKDFTLGAWVNGESFIPIATSARGIIAKYDFASGKRQYHLSVREVTGGSGTYNFQGQIGYNSGASGEVISHASLLSIGAWYFVAMSFDSSDNSWAIRVRDSQCDVVGTDATGTATLDANGISITDSIFTIGSLAASQYWDGKIDKAFIYNEVLSSGEIDGLCGQMRKGGASMLW